MPFPRASCCRIFSQSGFANGWPSRPSGSWVPCAVGALLVEQDEDDQGNLLFNLVHHPVKCQQEQHNSWNGLG